MKHYYFNVSQGLRGCYMPDHAYIVAVTTRQELKSVLESEAYYIRNAGFVGCSKRAIAWLAANAWQDKDKATLDAVVPYRNKDQRGYPYGLFCSSATKADYRNYLKEGKE